MPKSTRQRKDELLATIRAKKVAPVEFNNDAQKYNNYKKILTQNGIKNEKVINTQLNRMLWQNLPETAIYSNLKFMHLLRSRLSEEGIPLSDAELILEHVNFNMTGINEDDDYIGDVALEFAEVCRIYYDELIANPVVSDERLVGSLLTDDTARMFNLLVLELPGA